MEDVKGRTAFITGGSRAVETFKLDVRDRGGYARVADEAEARLGPVSILCNNAGVAAATRFTYEFWDWMLAVRRPLHNPPRRSSPLPVRERMKVSNCIERRRWRRVAHRVHRRWGPWEDPACGLVDNAPTI